MNKEIRLIFDHEDMKRIQNAYKLNTGKDKRGINKLFIKLSKKKAFVTMTTGYQGVTLDITKNVYNYGGIDESLIDREFTVNLPATKTRKKNDRVDIVITEHDIKAECFINNAIITEKLEVEDFKAYDMINKYYDYDLYEYSSLYVDIDRMIEVLQGLKARRNQRVKISINKQSELEPMQFATEDNDKAILLPLRPSKQ